MPKDDERFKDWIARYNKEKNWDPIVVPSGNDGAVRSTTKELGSLLEQSKATESKLGKELGELNMVVTDLVRKVRDEHRDLEKFRLENDLKIAQKKQKELSARHDIAVEVTLKRARLLKQMEDLDGAIREGILGLHGEMDEIERNSTKKTPIGDLSRTAYEKRRAEVAQAVDKVRNTAVTLRDPTLQETTKYNGISTPEYTLLQTMLQKADTLADNNDAAAGEKLLEDTKKKLDDFANARRGVVLAQARPNRNPEIEGPVARAQQAIAAIRVSGLMHAADALQSELDLNIRQFEIGKKNLFLGLKMEDLVKPFDPLAEKCGGEAVKLGPYKTALTEFARLTGELRILGNDEKAEEAELVWLVRNQSASIETETAFVESQIDVLRDLVTVTRDDLLVQENVDPDEIRQKLASIKENVETLYKHNRDGSRKTQTDAKSQAPKDVKKDSNIPREALDEIAMRVKMGELMLETNSVEAFKRAATYLDEIEKFETDIKDNSKNYQTIIDGIKAIRDIFTKLEKRYRPYLLERRSELKIATDAFDKDYKKQAPKTNTEKLKELTKKAEDILVEAKELKTARETFDKEETRLTKSLESLGKLIKKGNYSFDNVPLVGYWGQLTKDLAEAHGEAEKSDKAGLTNASVKLDEIQKKLNEQRPIVERRMTVGRDKMTKDEINQWVEFRKDAVKGQEAHELDEKAKVQWKKDHPVLEKRLAKIKETIGKLKLDASDIDLAIMELDALATEQKTAPDYVAALKELERISDTADAIEKVADELETFKADPIDKAANLVCDQLTTFARFVDGFEAKVRSADDDAAKKYDLGRFSGYVKLVRDAVPDKAIASLRSTCKLLVRDTSLSAETRELRESALADVRLINGRLRTSAAIKHFATQTFVADTSLDTALAALDRLQVKLLTLLK